MTICAKTPMFQARFRTFVFASLGLMLAGCMSNPETPPFYQDLARVDASVDQSTAQQMFSHYRINNGLGPLAIDPKLVAVAESQAKAMAAAGTVKVSLKPQNSLDARFKNIDEPKVYAVENVSAGYRTLAKAFSGWRDSPKHNAIVLDPMVTRFGIASAYSSGSKHKVFWSMVLAGPKQ